MKSLYQFDAKHLFVVAKTLEKQVLISISFMSNKKKATSEEMAFMLDRYVNHCRYGSKLALV
ncbi:MAG: hypothetical protein ACI808_000790 [Paraglaciecola sp.]|jgi:hypothetical protein